MTETYHPVVGGGETQARLLAEGLVKKGHPVIVITRRTDASQLKVERFGGITVYRIPPTGRQHLKKWALLLTSFPTLFRLRHQYDLIFVSGFRVIGIAAVLMSRLLRKPCLLKADNNGEMSGEFFRGGLEKTGLKPESPVFKIILKFRNSILQKAHGFIAISNQIAAEFSASGIHSSRIYCVPNSVDTGIFTPVSQEEKSFLRQKLQLPDNQQLVMFTGRLVSYKGLMPLLRVWKQLLTNQIQAVLVLVGGGSLDIFNCERQLKEYVHINELERSVIFTGEVSSVREYLQAADIFVFPTEKEAFGISVIEAMACSLPVIVTKVGGLGEVLTDRKNSLVINPRDEEGLYQALETLIHNPLLAESLGSRAVHTARQHYDTDMVTGEYLRIMRGISYTDARN